jgi:hypothetical protein
VNTLVFMALLRAPVRQGVVMLAADVARVVQQIG